MSWDEGWYAQPELTAGLYAMRDAGRSAVDALEMLRQTAQYITDHYGASGTGGTASASPDDEPAA